jgi:Flp pilus assembly pilin Flp
MKSVLARLFTRDEQGQGLMEYTLILSLVAVVCVLAVTTLGQQIVAALLEPAAAMFQ